MTVAELIDALDAYGGHLSVFVEDINERRYDVSVDSSIDRSDENYGETVVVIAPMGNRVQ